MKHSVVTFYHSMSLIRDPGLKEEGVEFGFKILERCHGAFPKKYSFHRDCFMSIVKHPSFKIEECLFAQS